MSWYLTIRPDANDSSAEDGYFVVDHLLTRPELVRTGPAEFRNAPDCPWVCVILVRADESGNYTADGELPPSVNVVEMICGDHGEGWYEALAGRIAAHLGWKAVEEGSDRTIRPPTAPHRR